MSEQIYFPGWSDKSTTMGNISENKLFFALFRHNDLPWNIRQFIHNKLKTVNFSSDLTQVSPWATSKWSHTDLPRIIKGRLGAQVSMILYYPVPTEVQTQPHKILKFQLNLPTYHYMSGSRAEWSESTK